MVKTKLYYWQYVYGDFGVCPCCHAPDYIDPLARYCRFCGIRIERDKKNRDIKNRDIK